MKQANLWVLGSAMICMASFHVASADELTAMVEKDLAALGYDVGNVDGEADVSTAIAISKYQAEKGMDVTGEVSPQLAGILAADVKKQGAAPAPSATAGSQDSAAQQVCLQQKIAATQQQQQAQKKNALGGMFSSLSKAAAKYGSNDVAKISADLYEANATMNDLAEAARELGISESEIAECESGSPSGTTSFASATGSTTAPVGSSAGTLQYLPWSYYLAAASSIGNLDGGVTTCNRGRPDYRQRFAAMVMEAHPSHAAEVLSAYDKSFAVFEINPEKTCTDEEFAELERVAGESAERAMDNLVIK